MLSSLLLLLLVDSFCMEKPDGAQLGLELSLIFGQSFADIAALFVLLVFVFVGVRLTHVVFIAFSRLVDVG